MLYEVITLGAGAGAGAGVGFLSASAVLPRPTLVLPAGEGLAIPARERPTGELVAASYNFV